MSETTEISTLTSAEIYRQNGRTNVFPTRASLDWFIRKHKKKLTQKNAIVYPTGRKLINPSLFDELLVEVCNQTSSGGAL